MAISFNQIPILLRTPGAYTEYDASRALQGVAALPSRILVIGSMLNTGTATALEAQQILSKDDGPALFGKNSQLADMLAKLKAVNTLTEVWAIGVEDDGSGIAATKEITFTNDATSDGVHHFLVAGRRVPVAVSEDDTPAEQATATAAAVNAADTPFTAAAALGVCTLTARHAAAFTEALDVRLNYYPRQALEAPSGTTVAIAAGTTGATNPDVSTVTAVLPDEHYTTVITGYDDAANMTELETWAATQWGPLVQRDVHIIAGTWGDFSTLSTYGGNRNSKHSTAMGAGESPTPAYELAAILGAVEEAEPDPARPRQTLPLPGFTPPAKADRFTQSERNLLLQNGIATFLTDAAGNAYIERIITTYQTNALGSDDPTYLDITTLRTLAALRYTLNNRIQTKYPRHKLASDGTKSGPGQPIVTPSVLRGEIIALYDQWADLGWTEGAAKEQFKSELLVERNVSDVNRVDAVLPPDLMNQFRVFAGQIQFLL